MEIFCLANSKRESCGFAPTSDWDTNCIYLSPIGAQSSFLIMGNGGLTYDTLLISFGGNKQSLPQLQLISGLLSLLSSLWLQRLFTCHFMSHVRSEQPDLKLAPGLTWKSSRCHLHRRGGVNQLQATANTTLSASAVCVCFCGQCYLYTHLLNIDLLACAKLILQLFRVKVKRSQKNTEDFSKVASRFLETENVIYIYTTVQKFGVT